MNQSYNRVRHLFKAFMIMMFALASINQNSYAQTTVQIGTNGALSSYFYGPMYRSSASSAFRFSMYSYLYTASELSAMGITAGSIINSVQFFKNSAVTISGTNTMNLEVWVKNTTATAQTTGTT